MKVTVIDWGKRLIEEHEVVSIQYGSDGNVTFLRKVSGKDFCIPTTVHSSQILNIEY